MQSVTDHDIVRPNLGPPADISPGWKRTIDLACCLAALPLLALLTVVVALLTRIASPGPVFFMQERVGYRGRRFLCYKFRTMKCSADTSLHQNHLDELIRTNAPMTKMDSRRDSRLIPGAWLLRATGLDELPQIINILRGEMSVVGPRPCLVYEFEKYLPWQKARTDTQPGLTGLWQVSGKNRLTFEQMIQLDIEYARTRTPWLDLKIILLTVPALILQVSDTRKARKAAALATPPRSMAPRETPLVNRPSLHTKQTQLS
jgi:lipopolysaccharide/colanic/teichoic acid biosynthesis glycosyltransferase